MTAPVATFVGDAVARSSSYDERAGRISTFYDLRPWTERHGWSPVQMALAWLRHHGIAVTPIQGARRMEQIETASKASIWARSTAPPR